MSKRAKIRQQHDERVICALKQLGMPATESVIASAARLPPHITMKALKRLIESGRVVSVMSEWGRVFYHEKATRSTLHESNRAAPP